MTPNEIFREILEDPILKDKYGLSDEKLAGVELYRESGIEIIEIIRTILLANSNNTSDTNTFRQIKNLLGIV
jgi:ribosomal protein RSM22 (predicted rRNA methylase)